MALTKEQDALLSRCLVPDAVPRLALADHEVAEELAEMGLLTVCTDMIAGVRFGYPTPAGKRYRTARAGFT